MPQEQHRATSRILDLLELLSGANGAGYTLTELSQALHIPKSSLFSIIHTLEERRYVHCDNSFIDSTQNIIGGALQGLSSGNVAGAAASMINSTINGAQDLTNTFANFSKASKTPNTQRGGTNSTTALVNFGTYTIGVRKYTCRAEIARQIDDFLSVYGYNVSVVKTPNITGRASWNYVKTVAANMSGSVPAGYLAMFNRLLDSGVTFWHTDDVGNYSLPNNII